MTAIVAPGQSLAAMPDRQAALTPSAAPQSLLRFLTCGSVDDGKSTLIGRILYECGAVFEDQLVTLEKESKKFGTDGDNLDFALLVDGLSAEREQGITIDVAYRYFSSPRRSFIVADTPGHEQYTRNMATGASTADLAVLLVDARKGILPQTRRHAFINSLLRVRHIVVAINKMDLVGFDRAVFESIVAGFMQIAGPLGFETITCIPLSARTGDNVTNKSARTPWYDGPALLEQLESIDIAPDARSGRDFLFPVQWVNRPDHTFRGFSGTIASGAVRTGDRIAAFRSGRSSRVTRIVTSDGDLGEAIAGQAVTLTLEDEIDISRGDVIGAPGTPSIRAADSIRAHLIWTAAVPGMNGSRYLLKLGTATVQARIEALNHLLDIEDYQPRMADRIGMNAVGFATLTLDTTVIAADYADNKMLGGFILIDRYSNETVAFGMIDDTAADRVAAPARNVAPQQKPPVPALVRTLQSVAGAPGSNRRQQFSADLAWRTISTFALFMIALAVTRNLLAAAGVAVLDCIVRPLLYRLHRRYWFTTRSPGDANDAGGGI